MKPYKITVEIKTKWTIEVHANDKIEAQQTAEDLNQNQIEAGGDFEALVGVEVVDVELLEEEDEDKKFIDMGNLVETELTPTEDEIADATPRRDEESVPEEEE